MKHRLFHRPAKGSPQQFTITEGQAAALLKKKLIQRSGSIPGEQQYFSRRPKGEIEKVMKTTARQEDELAAATV